MNRIMYAVQITDNESKCLNKNGLQILAKIIAREYLSSQAEAQDGDVNINDSNTKHIQNK